MNETEAGFAGAPDCGRHRTSGGEQRSPFQTRATFLANWNWESVVSINQRACARGGAQHGVNSETKATCKAEWEQTHRKELSLEETIHFLQKCHRVAPFLFFNGNTFSFIARELIFALFADLPTTRRRVAGSAVAHYVAGVLDKSAMVSMVDSLCESASFIPGDCVQTLMGSTSGVVIRILDDGRVEWLPGGSSNGLIALPESLIKVHNARF